MKIIFIINIGNFIKNLLHFNNKNKICVIINRDTLKSNYLSRKFYLEIELEDLAGFDEALAEKVYKQPTENLGIFEEATREVADEITAPRPEHETEVEDIQILLTSSANPINIRELKVYIHIL